MNSDDRRGPASGGPEDTELTVVARFRDPGAAQLARGYLEASGIPCFVYDYQTVSIGWTWSNALGGVRLMVPRDRAEEARQLLQTNAELAGFDGDTESHREDDAEKTSCPRCGSGRVASAHAERWWGALALLTLFVVVPIFGSRWKCQACGHQWKRSRPPQPIPDVPPAPADTNVPPGEGSLGFRLVDRWWILWAAMLAIAIWMARN